MRECATSRLPSGKFLAEIPGENALYWWAHGHTEDEARRKLRARLESDRLVGSKGVRRA